VDSAFGKSLLSFELQFSDDDLENPCTERYRGPNPSAPVFAEFVE
jgi:hypothetical protein